MTFNHYPSTTCWTKLKILISKSHTESNNQLTNLVRHRLIRELIANQVIPTLEHCKCFYRRKNPKISFLRTQTAVTLSRIFDLWNIDGELEGTTMATAFVCFKLFLRHLSDANLR